MSYKGSMETIEEWLARKQAAEHSSATHIDWMEQLDRHYQFGSQVGLERFLAASLAEDPGLATLSDTLRGLIARKLARSIFKLDGGVESTLRGDEDWVLRGAEQFTAEIVDVYGPQADDDDDHGYGDVG